MLVSQWIHLYFSLSLFFFSFCFPCSAGVGRTGCFIVIDAMLERIKHEKTVDIYGHVTLMRAQRNYMVQTEDQYIFIHDALLEAVTCGNTEVPARNLYAYIQKLTQIETGENVTGMELEFKVWYWMWCGNSEASHSGIVFLNLSNGWSYKIHLTFSLRCLTIKHFLHLSLFYFLLPHNTLSSFVP